MKMRVLCVMLLAVAATAVRPKIVFGGTVSRKAGSKYEAKGKQMEQGYLTAQKYFNEPGPGITVGGVVYDIELKITDDESQKHIVFAKYEELAQDATVHFLLGPYSSTLVDIASDAAEQYNKVMVEGLGASDALFAKGACSTTVGVCTADATTVLTAQILEDDCDPLDVNATCGLKGNRCTADVCVGGTFTPFKNIFATCNRAGETATPALTAFHAAGAKTVMFAHKDDAYTNAVNAGARAKATALGMTVLDCADCTMVSHKDTEENTIAKYAIILAEAKTKNPDIFFNFGHYMDAVAYTKTHVADGFVPKGTFMSASVNDHETYLTDIGGDAPLDVVGNSMWEQTMKYSGETFGTADAYAALYKDYSDDNAMTYQGAGGSAAVLALSLAIAAANGGAGSLGQDAVRTALRALDVDTFWGKINFHDTAGYNEGHKMGTIQLQFNEKHTIAPDHARERGIRYPSQEYCDANLPYGADCASAELYTGVVGKLEALATDEALASKAELTALLDTNKVNGGKLKKAFTGGKFVGKFDAAKVDQFANQPKEVKDMLELCVIADGKELATLNGITCAGADCDIEGAPETDCAAVSGADTVPTTSSAQLTGVGFLFGLLCLAF